MFLSRVTSYSNFCNRLHYCRSTFLQLFENENHLKFIPKPLFSPKSFIPHFNTKIPFPKFKTPTIYTKNIHNLVLTLIRNNINHPTLPVNNPINFMILKATIHHSDISHNIIIHLIQQLANITKIMNIKKKNTKSTWYNLPTIVMLILR